MQAAALLAPAVIEYVPSKQLIHVVDAIAPEVVEYVPATHFVQLLLVLAPVTF